MIDIYSHGVLADGAAMRAAKLFRNGDSQAVRLPKEFRFEGKEVLIERVGKAVVLWPKEAGWEPLLAARAQFSADFMERRDQPPLTEPRGKFD